MVKRVKPPGIGLWAWLGGHIKKGEQPHQAAIREAEEEAGIKLSELPDFRSQADKHGFIQLPQPAIELMFPVEGGKDPRHYHDSHVYLFRVKKQESRQEVGDDRSGHVEWVPLASLNEKNCFPPTLFLLKQLGLVE